MNRYRIDFTWQGSIYINAENKEDAIDSYYDMTMTEIVEEAIRSINDEIDQVEED